MSAPNVTLLPQPPGFGDTEEQFAIKGEAFLSALPQFSDELNGVADFVSEKSDLTQSNADSSQAAAGTAMQKADQASTSQAAAAQSETNAATSATNALSYKDAAENSANLADSAKLKAQDWAEKSENIEVDPGQFSAKHWAKKAQQYATGSLVYMGGWSPSTGVYPVDPATGNFYKVADVGSLGGVDYAPGDSIYYNGTNWEKIDGSDAVHSVAGHVGAVTVGQLLDALTAVDSAFAKKTDYATSTVGGTVKLRLSGDTLYITTNGNNA